MLGFLKKQANTAYTENGALTFGSTLSACLDLFSTIGAIRNAPDAEIVNRFIRAYAQNADIAMKTLFFARDIRGGLGERRVFRIIISYLAKTHPDSVLKNLRLISKYGRFDDLLVLLDTPLKKAVYALIDKQLKDDLKALDSGANVSLLAKWLPSPNASSKKTIMQSKKICKALHLTESQWRKLLAKLRAQIKIIENNLRTKDYTFDYSKQPSMALFKYRKAFMRNDAERYGHFLSCAENGEVTLNTSTLMPYEVISKLFDRDLSDEQKKILNATWNSLPDFTNGENALAVIDGSGSMYSYASPLPASVALSLGIYFAERNKGAFKNHFITFSEKPALVEINGNDIFTKTRYCMSFNEIANTNLKKVFELILTTAVKNKLPASQLPATLYIISDMEFDRCTKDSEVTNFEYAKGLFEAHGYSLPKVVFWNVASCNLQQPVTKNEQGVILVSGCNPRLFSMVTSPDVSPYTYMLETLSRERYKPVVA